MDDLHQQIIEGKIKELNLIIKADVQGSIPAVKEAFSKLEGPMKSGSRSFTMPSEELLNQTLLLSTASNAIIIGFNVRPTDKAANLARYKGQRRYPVCTALSMTRSKI